MTAPPPTQVWASTLNAHADRLPDDVADYYRELHVWRHAHPSEDMAALFEGRRNTIISVLTDVYGVPHAELLPLSLRELVCLWYRVEVVYDAEQGLSARVLRVTDNGFPAKATPPEPSDRISCPDCGSQIRVKVTALQGETRRFADTQK